MLRDGCPRRARHAGCISDSLIQAMQTQQLTVWLDTGAPLKRITSVLWLVKQGLGYASQLSPRPYRNGRGVLFIGC